MRWDDRGWGFLAADEYRTDFFEEYSGKDKTSMGMRLVLRRLNLVESYLNSDDHLVDVGIGGGAFVLARENTSGFDVDQKAIEWLRSEGRLVDSLSLMDHSVSFWDSFEHIEDPSVWLKSADYVFMSIPIFKDKADALTSKHYKPGEHLWYFTHPGLIRYMRDHAYEMVHLSCMEELVGREGISTYVFASERVSVGLKKLNAC